MRENERSDLPAFLALMVASVAAGFILGFNGSPAPVALDPIVIWCDGAADAIGQLRAMTDDMVTGFKQACAEDMASGVSAINPAITIEGFPGTVPGE